MPVKEVHLSDASGVEIKAGEGRTVTVSEGGEAWVIYLTDKEWAELASVYHLDRADKVRTGTATGASTARARGSKSGKSAPVLKTYPDARGDMHSYADIRRAAAAVGRVVPGGGRPNADLLAAFKAGEFEPLPPEKASK